VLLSLLAVQVGAKLLVNVSTGQTSASLRGKAPVGDEAVHSDWDYPPFQDPDVVAKYTDAESVQRTLFVIACEAKHKKDVDGKARDKAKADKLDEKGFKAYVKKLQDVNIADMKKRCGGINLASDKACKDDCTARWASGGTFALVSEKKRCVDRCSKKHTNWEAECEMKVDELSNVYQAESGNLANVKQCQAIHCKAFPEVLMMSGSEAVSRKREGCAELCTDKAIEAKCAKRWGLNVDTELAGWQDECHTEIKEGTLDPCMTDGTSEHDGTHDTCKSDGETKCNDAFDTCKSDGEAAGPDSMVGANAESICGVRKQVCEDQVTAKCMNDHKKNMDSTSKDCLEQHKTESKSCLSEKLEDGKTSYMETCESDLKPTCETDCKDDCKISEMNSCKEDMIKNSFGVAQEYCTKLWEWIFDSEHVDKRNMDQIPKADNYRFKKLERK